MAIDSNGNVYTVGHFLETADFDPGSGTFNLTSEGGFDVFISKLDSAGDFLWARRLGATSDQRALGTALDDSGNVHTIGTFSGTVDFDPGTGVAYLTSHGAGDVFVSKLDNGGNFVWARNFGGTSPLETYGVAVDSSGNVYSAGHFMETADFDPGPEVLDLTSAGGRDVFVSKLDSNGGLLWVRQFAGSASVYAFDLALDRISQVYTVGIFFGTADFDPGAGATYLTSAGGWDAYVSKLDAEGTFVWAARMGGTGGLDQPWGVAVHGTQTVCTVGQFEGTTDFDPGSEVAELSSFGLDDAFVSMLTAAPCADADLDGFPECEGDCNDSDPGVYPGAPQLCDGLNNDCDDADWPTLPVEELDVDHDLVAVCAGDCNDANPNTYPGAPEPCDGLDNDCNNLIDDSIECDSSCPYPDALDNGVRLTSATGFSTAAVLAWTGSVYGVAWCDHRETSAGQLFFSVIDAFGNALVDDRMISDHACEDSGALEFNGTNFAVVWSSDPPGTDEGLYFLRVDTLGYPIGTELLVTDSLGRSASLEWTGADYGIAWTESTTVRESFFVRVSADGALEGEPVILAPEPAQSPGAFLAWNGSAYGVAWTDQRNGEYRIYFTHLNRDGTQTGPEFPVTSELSGITDPVLQWNGAGYGLAWNHGNEQIRFVTLDQFGYPLSSEVELKNDPGYNYNPSLSWTGTEYGAAWHNFQAPVEEQVFFQRITAAGVPVGANLRVTHTLAAESYNPNISWNGTQFGIVWQGNPDGDYEIYFSRIGCMCVDDDADGVNVCHECDDSHSSVYPGAPEICDGLNNDCDDPAWPDLPPMESDDDADAYSECAGDCDDAAEAVYPGAPEYCDGVNNDCDDPDWPTPPAEDRDDDGDLISECAGDCDDAQSQTYPSAPQLCDGLNNDCTDPNWPAVPYDEIDDDNDTFFECQGDCDDEDPAVHPSAVEVCNSTDDNCNDLIDEDGLGEDTDADGIHNLCDNCRETVNPDQADTDQDSFGNACDNCVFVFNDQADFDEDDRGDVCDNCPESYNPFQDDLDEDTVGDVCDNCYDTRNPTQPDVDDDFEGDHCDLDDGLIYITFRKKTRVLWQEEFGYLTWNAYRGDLSVLTSTGVYTQIPGTNDFADRECGLLDAYWQGIGVPDPEEVAFFLATGVNDGGESDLGTNSAGEPRPNTNPCP